MGKRIISVLLLVGICLSVTACSPVENLFDIMNWITDNDNPLSGKSTDERIIMSLEDTYPEHTFSAINSFDNDKGEGLFSDEKGIKFRVHNLIYNNTYHFGCRDEYLSTILKNEDFFEKTKKVVEEKYGQKLVYNKNNMSIDIIYDDNNQITTDEISQLVQEVLNIVDTPKVKYPADREFSTNVVNYYTLPALGVLQCYIEKNEIGETELFYFSDKSMEQSVIKEKIDKLYQSVEE